MLHELKTETNLHTKDSYCGKHFKYITNHLKKLGNAGNRNIH